METWKTINTHPNYEASNLGNIRSKNCTYQRMHKGKLLTVKKKTLIIGPKLNKKGYCRVTLNQKQFQVHRIIAETFIPNPQNLPQVNHINGIKTDNRIENLEWVSNQENRDHAVNNNLIARREAGFFTKIAPEDVINIKELYSKGYLQKDIAKVFNTCQQHISSILRKY